MQQLNMLWYVLTRNGEYMIAACAPGCDPLYGRADFDDAIGPFSTWTLAALNVPKQFPNYAHSVRMEV